MTQITVYLHHWYVHNYIRYVHSTTYINFLLNVTTSITFCSIVHTYIGTYNTLLHVYLIMYMCMHNVSTYVCTGYVIYTLNFTIVICICCSGTLIQLHMPTGTQLLQAQQLRYIRTCVQYNCYNYYSYSCRLREIFVEDVSDMYNKIKVCMPHVWQALQLICSINQGEGR